MAYLDSMTDEERARLAEQGGGAPAGGSGGGGAPSSAPASAAPTSGFANLSNYFTANKDAATAQGTATADALQTSAESALRSDSPGTAMSTLGEINAGATPGGLATVLDDKAKDDPGYTAGMAGLDAYLGTRGAEPGAFEGLREMYGSRLPNVEAAVARPETPEGYNPIDPGGPGLPDDYMEQLRQWNEWRDRRRVNVTGEHAPERLPYLEDYYGSQFPAQEEEY